MAEESRFSPPSGPNILVVQSGDFHGKYGARAAKSAGWLRKYQALKFDMWSWLEFGIRFDIPSSIVSVFIRGSRRARAKIFKNRPSSGGSRAGIRLKVFFDQRATKFQSRPAQLVHTYSSGYVSTLKRARETGAATVIDWGIAHPHFVQKEMALEHARWGIQQTSKIDADVLLDELLMADRVVVGSEFVRSTFAELDFPMKRLRVIRYGVDRAYIHHRPPRTDSSEPLRILFVGGVGLRKGVLDLFEASQLLHKRSLPHSLTIVGGWTDGLREYVSRFFPEVPFRQFSAPQSRMPSVYRQHDVLVLPSIAEGMSRAVWEGMASGLACLVTPRSGFSGVIQHRHDGLFFDTRNPFQLAEQLQELHESRIFLGEIQKNASSTAAVNSWDNYQDAIRELYRELVV